MSFITVDDANSILGSDFAPDSDKARLVKLANVWMKNRIGFVPDPIDPLLKDAACEIIKGILAKVIYNGKEQLLNERKLKLIQSNLKKSIKKVLKRFLALNR